MSSPPSDRRELWWLTVAAGVLAVLRPDLYMAAAQHLVTAVAGHH